MKFAALTERFAAQPDLDTLRLAAVIGAWRDALPPVWADLYRSLPEPLDVGELPLDELVEALAGLRVLDGELTQATTHRRRAGVYHTPAWLVEHVLEAVRQAGPRWLDPACGAGAFLVGAARAGVPLDGLHGVDQDPLAVLATRLRLCALGGDPARLVAQIRVGDALLDRSLDGGFDAVVGNPPWGLVLTAAQRTGLADQLEPGEPCTAALFLRAALRQTRPGGQVGFVLPESWLCTRRAHSVRRWLLDSVRLEQLDVFNKRVFAAAPDMVPTVVVLRHTPPTAQPARVRCYGLRRPPAASRPVEWQTSALVQPSLWREEPLSVFAVDDDPRLADLWRRVAGSCVRLDSLVSLHDGIYKSHLLPWLGDTGQRTLTSARQLRRFVIDAPDPPRLDLSRLPASEAARMTAPKLLAHAMRKPAMPDRLVVAADPAGAWAASNNFVLLIPRPDCAWNLPALAALINSRVVNRWYAARFLGVNIEAFTLGSVPIPAQPRAAARLARLAREAAAGRNIDADLGAAVAAEYGVTDAESAAIDERWDR